MDPGLETVHSLAEQRLRQALTLYLENKDELDTFWRANPEEEYPWINNLKKVEPL